MKYFTWSLLLCIWKYTNLYKKGTFFLSLFSCNFDDQLNFQRFVSLCIILCCDKPSGLWHWLNVSSAFTKGHFVVFFALFFSKPSVKCWNVKPTKSNCLCTIWMHACLGVVAFVTCWRVYGRFLGCSVWSAIIYLSAT